MRSRMVVRSGSEWFETVDLTSKVGECLVGAVPLAVGAGTRLASGVDVVFYLEVVAD